VLVATGIANGPTDADSKVTLEPRMTSARFDQDHPPAAIASDEAFGSRVGPPTRAST
jgi:hypothetical protein